MKQILISEWLILPFSSEVWNSDKIILTDWLTGHFTAGCCAFEAVQVDPERVVGPSGDQEKVSGQTHQTSGVSGCRDRELQLDLGHRTVERSLRNPPDRSGGRKRIEVGENRVSGNHFRRKIVQGFWRNCWVARVYSFLNQRRPILFLETTI